MAKTRKINNALIRVFDQSSSIVYLISDEFKIGYANEACASWVGLELEQIVGTELVYSSQKLEGEAENAVKGLAIDPSLIASPETSGTFGFRIANNHGKCRAATANPIRDHRGILHGYLVVCSSGDLGQTEQNVREAINNPARLHEALMLVRQRHQQRFSLKRLVGNSAGADRLRRQVQSAINSDGDILIVGPRGSGREHVARTVFQNSISDLPPEQARLIPIHCSITDPTQIQATMKELLSEASVNSTLFLIDVDLMEAGSQQELLGYLQLPGLSARMIATSSSALIDSETGFDPTLAKRLSTMVIEIPPLADRLEDLPLLAQAILESKNESQARQYSGFSRQAIEMICEYDWPGNFGQLASAIEEAASNASGSVIEVADFSDSFHHAIKAQRFAGKPEIKIDLEQYLLEIEEQLIDRAVVQAKGNKTRAAELLGISRAKLLRRLSVFSEEEEGGENGELLDPSVFQEETDDDQ